MKLDVSLSKILLGVAGCSVAVCAYKFYSTKKNEQTSFKSEVTNTSDQKQNISAKSDKKGHGPSTLSSKKKVVSNNERSFVENEMKFKTSEADNVNNCEENNATTSRSSEVLYTNSNDSSMNMDTVDGDTVDQVAKFSAMKNEQTCSNIENNISNDANRRNSVKSNVQVHVNSTLISKERLPSEVKISLDENKVKFECLDVGNNINENAESSLKSTSIISDVNLYEDENQNQATGDDFVSSLDFSSKNNKNPNKTINTVGKNKKKKRKKKKKANEANRQNPNNDIRKSENTAKIGLVDNKPSLIGNKHVPSGVKLDADENKAKSEAYKPRNTIKERPEISMGKTNNSTVFDKRLTDVHSKKQILATNNNLRSTSISTSDKKEASIINMNADDNEIKTKEANLNGDKIMKQM